MSAAPTPRPDRVLEDLAELERRTCGPTGVDRVAWTPGWEDARQFLWERLEEIGLSPEPDQAANLWTVLPGRNSGSVILGSHLDSVPRGGNLDGALGVLAGLEVLRSFVEVRARTGVEPALNLILVDWADEEGARFGRSLFGSSAAAGTLDSSAIRSLTDSDGERLEDVVAAHGVELAAIGDGRSSRLDDARAYLELHIEQGPVLEHEGLNVAAVSGTVGVERFEVHLHGASAHAGSTPMDLRRDAALAAAELALEIERTAHRRGGRGTTGALTLDPGAVTVVAGHAELGVDLRHESEEELRRMRAEIADAAERIAGERGCEVHTHPVWAAAPTAFDSDLVELVRAECESAAGRIAPMVSGALHDATELAGVVPTAMVFCPSENGISHSAEEHTDDAAIREAVGVYCRVATKLLGITDPQASGVAP